MFRKERAKSTMPWVIGGVVALLATFALMMFVLPNAPNNNASHVPAALQHKWLRYSALKCIE